MGDQEGHLPVEELIDSIQEPQFEAKGQQTAALQTLVHDLQVHVDELGDDYKAKQASIVEGARTHLLQLIHTSVQTIAAEVPHISLSKAERTQVAQWLSQINDLLSFFAVEKLK